MFGLIDRDEEAKLKAVVVTENPDGTRTFTLPAIPKLTIPETIYEPITKAKEKWKALKAELAVEEAKRVDLRRELDELGRQEIDEERSLKTERTRVRRKIEDADEEIRIYVEAKIPHALRAVWLAAEEVEKAEDPYRREFSQARSKFQGSAQVILDTVNGLLGPVNVEHVLFGEQWSYFDGPDGRRLQVSSRIARHLEGVPELPRLAPEPRREPVSHMTIHVPPPEPKPPSPFTPIMPVL